MKNVIDSNNCYHHMIGKRFGKWKVLELVKGHHKTLCKCQCECGTKKTVLPANLLRGVSKSCGCYKESTVDMIGKRYGRYIIIGIKKTPKRIMCICQCDCGNVKIVAPYNLKSESIVSCGCHQREIASITVPKHSKKHGFCGTKIYKRWQAITKRCKPTAKHCKHNYYDRGITVCDEWKNHPEKFVEWAYKNGYSDDKEIDRIDNNKGYSPNNCRFTTRKENGRNRRTNTIVKYNGETMAAVEFAEKYVNTKLYNVYASLSKGWSPQQIIDHYNTKEIL